MSRSRRKTPIVGNACYVSSKEDKRIANRRFRRREKADIHHEKEPPTKVEEVADEWDFAHDGKHYVNDKEKQEEIKRKK